VVDVVLAYHNVALHLDPAVMTVSRLMPQLKRVKLGKVKAEPKLHQVPCCYELGEDLAATAEQLSLSPILMGAANSTGGVMGKMIDAQSIVVSSSATHQQGNEAAIFKAVFLHSIALACLVGLIVMFYAYVMPWVIPH